MIAKCTFTNAVNSLRLLLLATVCSLPACVNGAEISTECRTIIIASVLGTLAACTAVSIGLLIYVCRRARNNAMRESQRKMVTEECDGALHFRNEMSLQQGPDESDSGGERSSSPNRDDMTSDSKDAHYRTVSVPRGNVSDMSTQTGEDPLTRAKHQLAVLEKRQDGGTGLGLAVAGLYVKTVCSDLILRSGCSVEPGDEILSINGQQVEGMSDVEALALLTKSGPTVLLEIVKKSFIDRVHDRNDPCQQLDMKKRSRVSSPQPTISNKAEWKKARIEMDAALTELRRSITRSHSGMSKTRENSSPSQSLTNSVEVQDPIVEEEFVVIESEAVLDLQGETADISANSVTELAKDEDRLAEKLRNCDENENIVPLRRRTRSDLGVPLSNAIGKVSPVDRKAIQLSEVQSNNSKQSDAKIGGNSPSSQGSTADKQYTKNGLFLSLNAVMYPSKKCPVGDRTKDFTSPSPSKSSSMPAEIVSRDILVSANHRNSYYSLDNDAMTSAQYTFPNTPQLTVVPSYDLDKIKPPPCYEVASQIFNSQKPAGKLGLNDISLDSEGHRSDSMESQLSYQSLLNGFSSQHSSFDEVDAILPTIISKNGREQVAIDEHVMRYMTKKYSEPRMSTQVTRSPTSVSPSNPARLSTTVPASMSYRRSPVPSIERSLSIPTPYTTDRKVVNDEFHISAEHQASPLSSSMSQLAPSSSIQPVSLSEARENATKIQPHSSETSHSSASIAWISDGFPVSVNGTTRKNTPDQTRGFSVNYSLDQTMNNGPDQLVMASGNMAMVQSRKTVQANRLSRLHRQKGFSVENIRRAASSPSVNSDHQRNSSSESQNEAASGPRRAKSNRNGHPANDESFDRRKSIDSGSLRKLAAELQANQSLSDDLPMISRLLGGTKFQEFDKQNNLYRYKSSDSLHGRF
ncbi:uncharacterized protein LOC135686027 [Rhopilema esculentum]|uniref:uncharacterized protein LOC135686027 n=1 Tax=Rhopilema esculentum TaxID=499914 RepID=UPI0031CDEBD5|eukprot:gene2595-791_t